MPRAKRTKAPIVKPLPEMLVHIRARCVMAGKNILENGGSMRVKATEDAVSHVAHDHGPIVFESERPPPMKKGDRGNVTQIFHGWGATWVSLVGDDGIARYIDGIFLIEVKERGQGTKENKDQHQSNDQRDGGRDRTPHEPHEQES